MRTMMLVLCILCASVQDAWAGDYDKVYRDWDRTRFVLQVEKEEILGPCKTNRPACVSEPARKILALADMLRGLPRREMLKELDRHLHKMVRVGRNQGRWMGATEAVLSGKVDCKGYSVVAFVILREAGVPEGDVEFLYGVRGWYHLLLRVKLGDGHVLLDMVSGVVTEKDYYDTLNFKLIKRL
jgi:predicted transglutaminase-like cysteine proteinase